jgi:parallel beta-helix repeat protein
MPTVTGNIKRIAGTDVTAGRVVFTATTPVIQDRNAKTTRLGAGVAEHVVTIGASGTFTTSLPATGEGWVYEVQIVAFVGAYQVENLPTLVLPVSEAGADLSDAGLKGHASGQVVIRQTASAGELSAAIGSALGPFEASVTEAKAAAKESRDFAYRAEATVGGYEPRIKGIEAMAGLSPESPTDGQTSTLVSNAGTLTGQAVRTAATNVVAGHTAVTGLRSDVDDLETARTDHHARLQVFEQRTPEAYGALGNGTADDTNAILQWMQAGWSALPPRAYRITGGLAISRDDFKLRGGGATLIVDGNDSGTSRVLSVTGNNADISGLFIMGAVGAKIRGGIYVYGNGAKIQNNRVHNLTSDNESRGIHVEGTGGHHISGNRIHNISAVGNTVDGDGIGMARGIVIYHKTNAVLSSLVTGNHITDITGEEGDGISVLASDGSGTGYLSSKTSIIGNTVDNCTRRNVKIQGHDVDVVANILRDSSRQVFGKESSVINAYSSGRLSIKGNTLWYTDLGSSISIQGAAVAGLATNPQDVTISGNSVFAETGGTSTGIYVDYTNRVVVSGNNTRGGFRGIALGNVSSGSITGNTIERLTPGPTAYAASASSSCTRVAMVGNTDLSVNNANTFRNDSVSGVTANNHQITA